MTADDGVFLTVTELETRWRNKWGANAPDAKGIYRRIANGSLPATDTNPGGRRPRWLIPMSAVLAFEQETGQT